MTELSPVAVLDAVDEVPRVLNCTQDHPLFAAAALRAAALYTKRDRLILLSIAAELEGVNEL